MPGKGRYESTGEGLCELVSCGVEALVLPGEVERPGLGEVAVADDGAEGQDGFGPGETPSTAGDVESGGDEVTFRSFDDPAGDRPAGLQSLVVVDVFDVVGQVAAGFVRGGVLVGEMAALGFPADVGDGSGCIAGQDAGGFRPDPGRGVGGGVTPDLEILLAALY